MKYSPNQIYHLYNQGNNQQFIFFNKENYYYFLEKVRKYIIPNADILAYSLMPNHFHFLIWMKEIGCESSQQLIPGYIQRKIPAITRYQPNFSKDLAIMLRSYTRAINHQNTRSGSLFRPKTKCKQASNDQLINSLSQSEIISSKYDQTCFDYIHQNPVKAGLVRKDTDWPYSSAREYANQSVNQICNKKLAYELGLNYSSKLL